MWRSPWKFQTFDGGGVTRSVEVHERALIERRAGVAVGELAGAAALGAAFSAVGFLVAAACFGATVAPGSATAACGVAVSGVWVPKRKRKTGYSERVGEGI